MPLKVAPTAAKLKLFRTCRWVASNGKSYNVTLTNTSPLTFVRKEIRATDASNRTVTSPTTATTSNKTLSAVHFR